MLKKIFLSIFVLSCALSSPAANWKTQITMLVVPRDPVLIQIAQDISRRYPVLLVSYQQAEGQTAIHAWNGKTWVPLPEDRYARGDFFQLNPRHAVIVETEPGSAPEILVPDPAWCATGNRLATTDPRAVIHLLGRHFDFSYSHWMQFTRRYNYDLEAINPSLINVYWWHFRGKDILPALEKRDYQADMDKWLYLDNSPVQIEEPTRVEETPEKIAPPVDATNVESIEDMFEAEEPETIPENRKLLKKTTLKEEPAIDESREELVETDKYVAVPAQEIIEDTIPEEPLIEEETNPAEIVIQLAAPAEDPDIADEPKPGSVDVDPFSTDNIPAATIISPAK